jgi:hypothetical protein
MLIEIACKRLAHHLDLNFQIEIQHKFDESIWWRLRGCIFSFVNHAVHDVTANPRSHGTNLSRRPPQ